VALLPRSLRVNEPFSMKYIGEGEADESGRIELHLGNRARADS